MAQDERRNPTEKMETEYANPVAISDLLDRIPKTNDGYPILLGDTVYSANHDPSFFGDSEYLTHRVTGFCEGLGFDEYKGSVTVMGQDWEGGNLDCFHDPGKIPNQRSNAELSDQ